MENAKLQDNLRNNAKDFKDLLSEIEKFRKEILSKDK